MGRGGTVAECGAARRAAGSSGTDGPFSSAFLLFFKKCFFRVLLLFFVLVFWMINGVFTFCDVVLFGASHASAVPAASSEIGLPLGEGNNADAGFFTFLGVFAYFAALNILVLYVFEANELTFVGAFIICTLFISGVAVGGPRAAVTGGAGS